MKRLGLTAIAALLALACVPRSAAQQVTVNVNTNGQPASGVNVVFIAANLIKTPQAQPNTQPTEGNTNALNLGNMLKTRTAITDSSGSGVLNLSNIIKPHGQTEVQIVVRVCKDGKNVVYILQNGAQVPPLDEKCVNNTDCKCKDRPVAGLFLVRDGDTITVSINPETIDVHVTHTGGNAVQKNAWENPPVSVQLGGGAGVKRYSGINTCTAVIAAYPTCSSGQNAFNFQLEGSVNFGKYISGVSGFGVTNDITRKGSASSGNTEHSTVQTMYEPVAVRLTLPINRFQVFVQGGGAIYQIKLNETQVFVSGSSTTTQKTPEINSNGIGPMFGAGVGAWITPRLVVRAQWNQFTARDGNRLDEHNNLVTLGLYFRIP
jgi:hypothetical protein